MITPQKDIYKTIKQRSTGSFYDRKSRFIGIADNVNSETEIKEIISAIKKEYHDAVHHCYAWELFDGTSKHRFSDDGEPSGSAGIQIYNQLFYKNLSNILIVVVRYYGGIKLGVPGLINAYRMAAIEALNNSEIVEKYIETTINAEFSYTMIAEISKYEKSYNLRRISENYTDNNCSMKWSARASSVEIFAEKISQLNGVRIIKGENS